MSIAIVSAVRTAVGKFGGGLKDFTPGKLGSVVLKETIKRTDVTSFDVDEVIMGNVLSAGHGQNIARQSAIMAEDAEIVLAGGVECMSQAPYLIKKARWGAKMGNDELVDSMIYDGLWDIFNNYHMGMTAENVAKKFNVTREEQDEFSAKSQNKAENAIKNDIFKDEIIPIEIPQPKLDPLKFCVDEFPRFGTTKEILAKLKPAFKKDGTVTAGNSSGINDGAAAVLLMSEEKAKE